MSRTQRLAGGLRAVDLVVNALLLLLMSEVAQRLDLPFHVDGLWPAFFVAVVVGLVVLLPANAKTADAEAGDEKSE